MRTAYAYAESGGRVPLELEAAWRISDIGPEAVLGERAAAYMVRRVALSHAVYLAYCGRRDYRDEHGAENWAKWSKHYPDQNRLLMAAMKDSNE